MSEALQQIRSYLGHLVKARNRHGVHSPFVYDLIHEVLRPRDAMPEFAAIESLREELLISDKSIRVNDLGAGSRVFNLPTRRVSDIARSALKAPKHAAMLFRLARDIARSALKAPKHAAMLFRLARYFQPAHVLELGTSFGISTLYLARGADDGSVVTIEGCPQTQGISLQHFERLKQRNITPVLGSFRSKLPDVLQGMERLDMVFIDGHHAKEPTLDYFEQCLSKAHNDTVLVLDDIHWSAGMEEAWAAIKENPRVSVTIDLYDMGLVFLRKEQAPEHFVLRY